MDTCNDYAKLKSNILLLNFVFHSTEAPIMDLFMFVNAISLTFLFSHLKAAVRDSAVLAIIDFPP